MSDSLSALLDRIGHLHPKKIDLSLSRIERLLANLEHPERRLPATVHVAGTNGKGSTIAFMRACLEAAGYRVHVYTSPHLVHFSERIVLAGKQISDEDLIAALKTCEYANRDQAITFFEITTAAAFWAFAQTEADVLLLEVGLGGRYDATNVVRPHASVITPVSRDHKEFLGNDLGGIAGEKAGILKSGVPGIIGPQQDDALSVIRREAALVNAPLIIHGQEFMAYEERGRLTYQGVDCVFDMPLPSLAGRHQFANAATAIAALQMLEEFNVPLSAMEQGLSTATWPARLQNLKTSTFVDNDLSASEIWLDGGHNESAGRSLAAAMADLNDRAPKPLYLIVGMMANKNAAAFLGPFRGLAKRVIAVPIDGQENGALPENLAAAAASLDMPSHTAKSPHHAVRELLSDIDDPSEQPRILICGSLYLAGNVLAQLPAARKHL